MARLIDHIRRDGYTYAMDGKDATVIALADDTQLFLKDTGEDAKTAQRISRSGLQDAMGWMLDHAEIIAIDNVAAYLAGLGAGWTEPQRLRGLSITPPFDRVWVEWAVPPPAACAVGSSWIESRDSGVTHYGCIVEAFDFAQRYPDVWAEDPELVKEMIGQTIDRRSAMAGPDMTFNPDMVEDVRRIDGVVRWMVQTFLFLRWRDGHVRGPLGVARMYLDDLGRLCPEAGNPTGLMYRFVAGDVPPDTDAADNTAGSWVMTFPALFGLSMMHLKNATLDVVTPPERLNKRTVKRGHQPFVSYKVLTIEPGRMSRRSAHYIAEDSEQHKRSFHIVRGHHAEYGPDYHWTHKDGTTTPKGLLFGKYAGKFWVQDSTRGELKVGTAVKDYNVKPDRKAVQP